ncbi:trimethylamine methyltransferase family protein [Desulfospira joergensenii]|uniref:trimethylamine methyltransferase family protein n=1 Tax=Desulfospira joergensenii TaxID=53329 RepID=UPI0003B35520|nr:trimethylamine methyltransferase family protein [Desulfospira joergensenii]
MGQDLSEKSKVEKLILLAEKILAEVGIKILSKEYFDLLSDRGLTIKEGRIFFTKDEIQKYLAMAPGPFTLYGINPVHDMAVGRGLSQTAPGYGCSSVMDPWGETRDARFQDHLELVKLVHQSPCFAINGGILAQPSDIPAEFSHLAMHYASLVYSDKCIMGMPGTRDQMEEIMTLTALRLGGEEILKQSPRIITMISPISPLQMDRMGLNSIEIAARYHQPIMASPGVAAGTTGPVDLASNLAMATAEALCIIMIAQVFNPGTPAIFGLQCYGSDMKTGNISTGSPAYALQAKYCAALARHFNLPSRAGGAVNDARSLSAQAGYESMLSIFTAIQNNISIIVHSAGIMNNFAAMSFEKFIMDLEMIRMARFYMDDLDVNDEALNFELIREIGPGGLFLTSMDTMKKCRTHAWNPDVALRGPLGGLSPEDKLLDNIQKTREKMLAAYTPPEIDPEILDQMNRFMKEKGMDPSALPLENL